jgi:malonyl-CoA O-methyltransferase
MAAKVAATLSDPRQAYDLWADSYPAEAHNPLMRLEQEIVESVLAIVGPKRALDVGTGSGRYLPILARAGAQAIVGVDFSRPMLHRAGADPCVRSGGDTRGGVCASGLVCADALHLPFMRRSFDLINASLMVGDVPDLGAWTREMTRVLVRGGHVVYSDFHPLWAHFGWKRTFRGADGALHEIPFAAHAIEQHQAALDAAGLRVVAIREPRFKDDSDAGVRAFRRRWRNPPVVVVFHAVKDQ